MCYDLVLTAAQKNDTDGRTEEDCEKDYRVQVEAIERYGLGNVSYDPKIRSCVDLAKTEEQDRFFNEFTDGGMPVYIIAITNNEECFNETTMKAYVKLCTEGKIVMLGQWTDPNGSTYKDVITIMSGINRDQALKYKKQYGQLSIMEIRNDASRYL